MIVVAGEALVDLVIDTEGTVVARLGGGPYNVARTLGRLGSAVTFLGAVSTDRFGSQLFAQLAADGVSADAILRTELPTTLAAAELNATGGATYRFYFDGTSAPSLCRIPDAARRPVAVHVGTLGLVLEPMATTLLDYLAELADDTVVFLDPNCRPGVVADRAAYTQRIDTTARRADIVKVSDDDARYLAPDLEPIEFARHLVQAGTRLVLLTLGAEGTIAVAAEFEELVPAERVEVADTIGAGDSFCGGFLAWWLASGRRRTELRDSAAVVRAISAAQAVAAVTCGRVGADPPRRSELDPDWFS